MNHQEKIDRITREINASGHGLELKPQHFLGEGVYVRTLSVPAGYAFVGKKHKTKHVFAIIEGIIIITDENGNSETYEAPYFMVSEIGTQRTLLALTDCIIMNAHSCNTDQSVEGIEDDLVIDTSVLDGTGKKVMELQ